MDGERINPCLVEALEDKLYLWGSVALDLGGVSGNSALCAIEVHAAHRSSRLRQKQYTAQGTATRSNRVSGQGINEELAAPVEEAMAIIKRETPKLYEVLKVEARSLLLHEGLSDQRSRARCLKISLRTYQTRLHRARIFLAGLLFGPQILRET
ncbi:hypothetical protein [uncultured Microbulbifer sp.]|uniref:hypothetical protein n=1 Tax=uncultured Microbulbifer sp. TaxID=348147 RepID=UPI0026393FA8|nr:hypothetical protein [uncultured Microbulbifer sp.]